MGPFSLGGNMTPEQFYAAVKAAFKKEILTRPTWGQGEALRVFEQSYLTALLQLSSFKKEE